MKKALDIHENILSNIKTSLRYKHCKLYIVGDLNFDLLEIDQGAGVGDYFDSMMNYGLLPCITKPTRIDDKFDGLQGPKPSLLDHIFYSSLSPKFGAILLSGLSDHFPVLLLDQIQSPSKKDPQMMKRLINDKTIDNLTSYLREVSWQPILDNLDPESASNEFFDTLLTAVEDSFPIVQVKHRPIKSKNSLLWFSEGLARSSRKKCLLYAKFKKKILLKKIRLFTRIINKLSIKFAGGRKKPSWMNNSLYIEPTVGKLGA